MNACVIDGCDKPSRRGKAQWCEMHYHRWYRNGDPNIVREIKPKPEPLPDTYQCVVCGNSFERSDQRPRKRCPDHRKHKKFQCGTCGDEFWSNRHTSLGNHYCSKECHRRPTKPRAPRTLKTPNPRQPTTRHTWRYRRPSRRKPLRPKQCVICGAWICGRKKTLCGNPNCTRESKRLHGIRKRREAGIPENHCRTCLVPVQHPLQFCGKHREAALKASRRRMTQRSHAKYGNTMHSRARSYGVEYEPVNRLKVFARDAWRCGICGEKVNKRLKGRHPMMASLDHITPMALGGGHTYANTQCSHLICNLKKGHRSAGDQMALFG